MAIKEMRFLIKPMEELIKSIEELKNSEVKDTIDSRIREFEELGDKPSEEIFKEMCFCIMTANFNAKRCMEIQDEIGKGFCYLAGPDLIDKLKEMGHRFPNARGKYITEAREHMGSLKETIDDFENERELREWVVDNVKGLGYKEASHFLRNIGFKNLAIIDFHIIDLLVKHGLIERPKTLTKNRYLKIEEKLKEIAEKSDLSLAELDLYLWYMETGKILK